MFRSLNISRSFVTKVPKPARAIRKLKDKREIVVTQRARNASLQANADAKELDWRIVGASILHRYPIITPKKESWEIDMTKLQDKLDDKKRQWLSEQLKGSEAHIFPELNPSYEEILESMPFQPAPTTTEADATNDRRSLNRRLHDSLFLIVKRNRKDNAWQFPQGKLLEKETIRQTQERVMDRAAGKTERWFISNSPCGHYQYEYPPAMQDTRKAVGAKVFYGRCQFISGTVKLQTKLYTDYAWVARDEMKDYFEPDHAHFLDTMLPY
jgi:hypothetical protein